MSSKACSASDSENGKHSGEAIVSKKAPSDTTGACVNEKSIGDSPGSGIGAGEDVAMDSKMRATSSSADQPPKCPDDQPSVTVSSMKATSSSADQPPKCPNDQPSVTVSSMKATSNSADQPALKRCDDEPGVTVSSSVAANGSEGSGSESDEWSEVGSDDFGLDGNIRDQQSPVSRLAAIPARQADKRAKKTAKGAAKHSWRVARRVRYVNNQKSLIACVNGSAIGKKAMVVSKKATSRPAAHQPPKSCDDQRPGVTVSSSVAANGSEGSGSDSDGWSEVGPDDFGSDGNIGDQQPPVSRLAALPILARKAAKIAKETAKGAVKHAGKVARPVHSLSKKTAKYAVPAKYAAKLAIDVAAKTAGVGPILDAAVFSKDVISAVVSHSKGTGELTDLAISLDERCNPDYPDRYRDYVHIPQPNQPAPPQEPLKLSDTDLKGLMLSAMDKSVAAFLEAKPFEADGDLILEVKYKLNLKDEALVGDIFGSYESLHKILYKN